MVAIPRKIKITYYTLIIGKLVITSLFSVFLLGILLSVYTSTLLLVDVYSQFYMYIYDILIFLFAAVLFSSLLSSWWCRQDICNPYQAKILGLLSGFITSVVIAIFISIFIVYTTSYNSLVSEWSKYIYFYLIVPVIFLPVAMLCSSIYYLYRLSVNAKVNHRLLFTDILKITLVLAVLLVFPLVVFIVLDSVGLLSSHLGGQIVMDFELHRSNTDEIRITNNVKSPCYAMLNSSMPFSIMINDLDASNRSAIARSGLAATIKPEDGLHYNIGSKVTLKGPDIVAKKVNYSSINQTRVCIVYHLKNGSTLNEYLVIP